MKPHLRPSRANPGMWECDGNGRIFVDTNPWRAYFFWRLHAGEKGIFFLRADPDEKRRCWWEFWK